MPIDLQGRPIAITGASSGIGAATALACARAGMPVALCARREDKLAAVADECRKIGVPVFTMVVDVADAGACGEFIRGAIKALGGLYAVDANAGYGLERPILETTDAQLREIFEVNFFGTFNVVRPAVEFFRSKPRGGRGGGEPRGHVIICSSCLAKMTIPYYSAYSATKSAQNHVGRAMRLELEPEGIHVSTIHPITTRTELFDKVKERSGLDELKPHAPGWLVQDAELVARCTVKCLRRPRPEVWTGFKGRFVRFGMAMCTLFPGLLDFNTRGMVRSRHSTPPPAGR